MLKVYSGFLPFCVYDFILWRWERWLSLPLVFFTYLINLLIYDQTPITVPAPSPMRMPCMCSDPMLGHPHRWTPSHSPHHRPPHSVGDLFVWPVPVPPRLCPCTDSHLSPCTGFVTTHWGSLRGTPHQPFVLCVHPPHLALSTDVFRYKWCLSKKFLVILLIRDTHNTTFSK